MIALLRTEWSKTLRRPRTYIALGFVVFLPAVIALALWANPPESGHGPPFFAATVQSGLLYPAAVLNIMSRLVLIVVVALFAGDAIAGEASTGNLRYLLLRPLARGRLLTAKLVVAVGLTLVTVMLVAATATLAGGFAFGFEPVRFHLYIDDQSVGNLLIHIGMATGYVTWTLASVVAFGFMISTMSDSPAAASGAAVGLGVASQILNEIEALGSVRQILPTRYFDAWTGLFWSDRVPDDMWSGLVMPIPFIVVFCGIAFWWFRRKDVLS